MEVGLRGVVRPKLTWNGIMKGLVRSGLFTWDSARDDLNVSQTTCLFHIDRDGDSSCIQKINNHWQSYSQL